MEWGSFASEKVQLPLLEISLKSWELTYILLQGHHVEDEFPNLEVGYVRSLEGVLNVPQDYRERVAFNIYDSGIRERGSSKSEDVW